MRRVKRLIRVVLVPVAALTILVASAVPASADTTPTVSASIRPIITFSLDW